MGEGAGLRVVLSQGRTWGTESFTYTTYSTKVHASQYRDDDGIGKGDWLKVVLGQGRAWGTGTFTCTTYSTMTSPKCKGR